ncbi:MAG: hypothetical protein JO092_06370 [Candidatus Eremiobacteraeota bacterium]|nr:hypothetical protein [Candidatus Eremiobacteraeota bacterium]
MELTKGEIDELLARHRLLPSQTSGSTSTTAAQDGILASLYIGLADGKQPVMHVAIGRSSVAGPCPLDRARALSLAAAFRRTGQLPESPSFEHLVANLLEQISAIYFDECLETLAIGELRLHPTVCRMGRITAHRLPT